MNTLGLLKDFIEIDGEKYYHYTNGGKYKCTKFIVVNGIHYYNGGKSLTEDMI